MRRRWGIISGALMTSIALCGAAIGGPWTQAPDETLAIFSLRYITTEFSEPSEAAFRQPTLSLYAEHGLKKAITVGMEAEGTVGVPARGTARGGGGARAFLRGRLWEGEKGEIISAEVSFGVQADVAKAAFIQPRLSFLYGEGYDDGWYDIATSVRLRGGDIDELHSDATYGYRPANGWMTYFQINTIQRLKPKIGEDLTTTRFGLFVGYDIEPDRTIVVGARREFFNTFAPPAVEASISLWARF